MKENINVTKTYLPNINKYIGYLSEIYKSGQITNNGQMVKRLEKRLSEYLGVKNIVLVANGTVALEIAYRTLNLKGFVITTPFSFVATTSSLVTNGLIPIFTDIDKNTLNIDPSKISDKITPNTSAIVATHVFGNPCDIDAIQQIANNNNLKVIYDAAHAFGIDYKNKNISNYGDISTLSFHATKLFHTIEGGALIINDDKLAEVARYLINFGIKNQEEIPHLGTNAKMNEFEAAMGLCVLDDIEILKSGRKIIYDKYYSNLKNFVQLQERNILGTNNFNYFPILLENEEKLLKIQKALNIKNIYPRRYFYPSLDTLKYIEPKQECIISRSISKRILCLPIYFELEESIQNNIIEIIKSNL